MTFFQQIETFIGQQVSHASKIVVEEDGEALTCGIAFQFDSRLLILKAEPDTDTITVCNSADLDEWLNKEPLPGLPSRKSCDMLRATENKTLTNVWQCHSTEDYLDAIDFGFGDLNFPTMKVFCITSELYVLSIAAG